MAMLQRRFASSIYAVRRSLQRMKDKREHILADPEGFRQSQINKRLPDDYEDLPEEEQQEIVSELEDLVASYDPVALRDEITELGKLIQKAVDLEKREVESKLIRLRELIKEYGIFADPKMKLLIFTEHKDTLDFLCADGKDGRPLGKLREWGLNVTQIHGGMKIGDRDTPGTRIYAEREFRESAQVLVATEAAGEGINLQFCWLMINYDIPWNPVRLEQRMGRIHRYGQEKDCLIFNFVSTNTREGRVLHKLFERIQAIEDDLDPKRTGKVFNVLGDVFPANQLEKMIRDMYAHNQMDEELIKQRIVEQVDTKRLQSITDSTLEGLAKRELNLSAIIGKSAEARERRLVPEVIEEFFIQAAPIAGVNPNEIREGGHVYKLGKVPRSLWPVGERLEPRFGKLGRDYKNIVFDKEHLKRDPTLEWVTPGHPLFEAVREDVSEHVREDLLRGAVFYDLHQAYPYRLDVFAASIKDGRNNQLHRRIFVVEACLPDRQANHSSTMTVRQPTIFLDLALASKDARVPDGTGLPDRDAAERFLVTTALNPFLAEVATQRARETATIEKHLKISLNELIHRQNLRMAEIHESGQFGDETLKAANMKKVEDKLDELNGRLEQRTAELRREAECMIGEIQHVGRAWVLPHPERNSPQIREMVTDPEIERIAVQHAIAHETAQGRVCESVEADNRGFDLISRKFELPGQTPGVFFVYAILCKDNTIYIGQTENLAQRWNEHRTGQGADWTASHGVQYVLHYEQLPSREAAVEMERQWKSGSGRDALKAKTQDRHLPAGRQVDVRFIEVKGRSHTGDIALTTNEYNTARRLRKDYWLYIVFHCASPNPSLNILNDPSTLDWQPIVKVEHYRLKQDSVKHPVELKEDSPPYRTGGEK
jgi:predicted GIY-YIG superfamily endonuclease